MKGGELPLQPGDSQHVVEDLRHKVLVVG